MTASAITKNKKECKTDISWTSEWIFPKYVSDAFIEFLMWKHKAGAT